MYEDLLNMEDKQIRTTWDDSHDSYLGVRQKQVWKKGIIYWKNLGTENAAWSNKFLIQTSIFIYTSFLWKEPKVERLTDRRSES
jgi:hypothetical protein